MSGGQGPEQLGSKWALPGAESGRWSTAQRRFPNPIFSPFPGWGRHTANEPGSPWPLRFQGSLGAWDSAKPVASGVRCPCLSPDRTASHRPSTELWGPKLDYKWNKALPRPRDSLLFQTGDRGPALKLTAPLLTHSWSQACACLFQELIFSSVQWKELALSSLPPTILWL